MQKRGSVHLEVGDFILVQDTSCREAGPNGVGEGLRQVKATTSIWKTYINLNKTSTVWGVPQHAQGIQTFCEKGNH